MAWSAIAYTSSSSLVRIDGTSYIARYIPGVLRPVALPFFRALRSPTFQQDNARPHVAGLMRTFLDTENVRLFPCPERSSDLSPIENVWSMVAKRLARHYTLVTMVDCGIVLKLHGHLYLYMLYNLCLTQCPGTYLLLLLPEVVVLSTHF
ncbi:transposable element Tcb1 transposase [Trichonephila clavipes]|nr:transposable element Tcb1 transposase [Trichonephila clavipes]